MYSKFLLLVSIVFPIHLHAANCTRYATAKKAFQLQSGELKEISGIISSTLNEGIYWVHNDSGSRAEIFAIDNKGNYIAKIKLLGIRFKDAEDITIAKCENGKNCLVVGDVGNNKGDRKQLKLYSVPEPYLDDYEEFKEFSFYPKTIRYEYQDRSAYDAESIAYYSIDDKIYIVRKDGEQQHQLYKVNQDQYSLNKAEYVCSFQGIKSGHVVTSADIHWSENVMLLRTYNPSDTYEDSALYEYPFEKIKDVCFNKPKRLQNASEGQGEAVAYNYFDGGVVHISEGYKPSLYKIGCL